MLQTLDHVQKAGDFLWAQHNGKLLQLLADGDVVLNNPGPFEGDGVEEPERGYRDANRTGGELLLLDQMKLPDTDPVLAKVLR